jgi:tRNA (guanine37-N1)-methyltransferase
MRCLMLRTTSAVPISAAMTPRKGSATLAIMRFDLVTIFPEFFAGPLQHGIVRRAQEAGIVRIHVQDLREFTKDRHRTVDDRPFGGGEGMVLKPEPLFEAVEALLGCSMGHSENPHAPGPPSAIVLLSAAGKRFDQSVARRLASLERIVLLCGRYEGVDERVAEHLATDELSIGDFVLSGGELPALLIIDAVTRLLPGALGNEASSQNESFADLELHHQIDEVRRVNVSSGAIRQLTSLYQQFEPSTLLDFPHYTRPAEFRGWSIPEVLISGNHEQIRNWRREMALKKTIRNRPDLLNRSLLDKLERELRES